MNKVQHYLLNYGPQAMLRQMSDLFGLSLHSFIIGNATNFIPAPEETAPRGNTTFTGDKSLMKLKTYDFGQSMQITMVIPEQYMNIEVGNVVVYALFNGEIKPVLSLVLGDIVRKQNATPQGIGSENFKYPGNRLIISFVLKYVELDEYVLNTTVNIVTPAYSNIPFFGDESTVPDPLVNPYQQFIINDLQRAGGAPAFVHKDLSDVYWSNPLWEQIDSPKYGVIDGGVQGDGAAVNRASWVWGGYYGTSTVNAIVVGGLDYEADTTNAQIVGGLPY